MFNLPDDEPDGEAAHDEPECFRPTPEDEAWDLGYRLHQAGEDGLLKGARRDVAWSFVLGKVAATKDQLAALAYQAGYSLGLDRDAREVPTGSQPREKDAFLRGFVRGRADDDARTEALIASRELDHAEGSFLTPYIVTDRDMYPHGGMS